MTPLKYSDFQKRGAPATTDRRNALLAWLRERPEHRGLTAREIVDASDIYSGNGRQEKCVSDLRALRRFGFVWSRRQDGERWEL